jgi:hypothetical protein
LLGRRRDGDGSHDGLLAESRALISLGSPKQRFSALDTGSAKKVADQARRAVAWGDLIENRVNRLAGVARKKTSGEIYRGFVGL